jgi:rhodanese-related sulfurtransferase
MIIMKQILPFIQNHWMLCSALAAVLIALIFEEIRGKMGGIPKISAQTVTLLLNRENAVVVDLRVQPAFISGHVLGAINVAYADFDAHLKKIESHKNHALILLSDNETHAASIGAKLQKQGFTKVYILANGLQAWKDAHLPLTKN